jgi:hypothetical protein
LAIFPVSRPQLLRTSAATITVAGITPNVAFEARARSEVAQQALAPPLRKPKLKVLALLRYFVSERLLSGIGSGKKLASHSYRYQRSFVA